MYRLRRPLEESRQVITPPDTEKFPKQCKRFVVVEAQVAENFDRFKKKIHKEK
jgi:hypothetical protein